jgi:hypothetical protein
MRAMNPPLSVGDRVGNLYLGTRGTTLGPAIVLALRERHGRWYADFRMQHGDERNRPVHPDFVSPTSELLPETRQEWEPIWERLAAEDWSPDDNHPDYLAPPE